MQRSSVQWADGTWARAENISRPSARSLGQPTGMGFSEERKDFSKSFP